jgi:hypothetical protein
MNDREHELFETELRRLKPAAPPEEFMDRLTVAQPVLRNEHRPRPRPAPADTWWRPFRWLGPAAVAAAAVVVVLVRQLPGPEGKSPKQLVTVSAKPALNADDVEIDQRLLAAFDAVARMPDGEPVRFRCREWMENVALRDSSQGVVVEQRTPHLEVVPVSFETY